MSQEEMPEYNPHARAALLQGVEDQLSSPETPEVRAELARLEAAGVETEEAKEMIATILAFHITRMVKWNKPFDYSAYLAELRKLPEIDYDEEL